MMRLDEETHGWPKLRYKAVHSGRASGHADTEEDVDGDWVDEDNATVGEGGRGPGQKTKPS